MRTTNVDLPNYFEVLNTSSKASDKEVQAAYKCAVLPHHPDMQSANARYDSEDDLDFPYIPISFAQGRSDGVSKAFALINEAYLVLSDPKLRAQYERALRSMANLTKETKADALAMVAKFQRVVMQAFGSGDPGKFTAVFNYVFEPLLARAIKEREGMESEKKEGEATGSLWTVAGASSAAAFGFVAGNAAGAIVGGMVGAAMGYLRDLTGKAALELWCDMLPNERHEVLLRVCEIVSKQVGCI
ncbi:Diphthamide biosynthesis protein 4 [Blastocladiella emersonii ATCC 22665]|nr:Diphthamide biosynthesis protein 4 [Blastocladiella emersonii ATCC 22665]